MSKIRTFVAVEISSRIQTNVTQLIQRFQSTKADYNWVMPRNLHVTLNFFGDVLESEVTDLCRDIKKIAARHEPFSLGIGGTGCFPNAEEPRVVWLGIEEGADELAALNQEVDELMKTWGFPKDRHGFTPHLTLGRLRRGGRWNQSLTDMVVSENQRDLGGCDIQEIVVFSSHIDKSGPSYTVMSRAKLDA